MYNMVWVEGLEPPISPSQTVRDKPTSLHPDILLGRGTWIRTKDYGFGDRCFATATTPLHKSDHSLPTTI